MHAACTKMPDKNSYYKETGSTKTSVGINIYISFPYLVMAKSKTIYSQ